MSWYFSGVFGHFDGVNKTYRHLSEFGHVAPMWRSNSLSLSWLILATPFIWYIELASSDYRVCVPTACSVLDVRSPCTTCQEHYFCWANMFKIAFITMFIICPVLVVSCIRGTSFEPVWPKPFFLLGPRPWLVSLYRVTSLLGGGSWLSWLTFTNQNGVFFNTTILVCVFFVNLTPQNWQNENSSWQNASVCVFCKVDKFLLHLKIGQI